MEVIFVTIFIVTSLLTVGGRGEPSSDFKPTLYFQQSSTQVLLSIDLSELRKVPSQILNIIESIEKDKQLRNIFIKNKGEKLLMQYTQHAELQVHDTIHESFGTVNG